MKYRPEIDGLRAIAVMSVILYHAGLSAYGFTLFKGGFIGVDIFFVISGYLITSILLREMADNRFTFIGFYERRARRILPALFVVMFTSIPFAWMYVFPKAFREYADSIVASTLFVSNIYFWREDAYTAEASALKPFLHTWSLSVEEQFYLLFPIVLLLCWKFAQKHINILFICGLVASLVLADWASQKHANASFFLLPTRGWELLAGAWLARIELERGRTSHPILDETMPALGLVLIAHSIIFFSAQTTHPGFRTLSPIIGTMLLIWFSGRRGLVSEMLSSRLFVGVGLISYSLYLWHPPIFSFARIRSVDALSDYDKLQQISLTFLMAGLTWLLIEKVFRNRQRIGKRTLWTVLCAAAVLFVGLGVLVQQKGGIPERFDYLPRVVTRDAPQKVEGVLDPSGRKCMNRDPKDACILNGENARRTISVVGDSHARVLSLQVYDYALKNGLGFVELTMSGCAYLPNADLYVDGKKDRACTSDYQDRRFEVLTKIAPGIVVLHAGRLPMYLSGTGFDNGEGGVEAIGSYMSVHRLSGNKSQVDVDAIANDLRTKINKLIEYGHRIVLIYPVPEVGWSLPGKLKKLYLQQSYKDERRTAEIRITTRQSRFHERSKLAYLVLDRIGTSDRIGRIYPETVLCSSAQDRCETQSGDELFYADSHHLSVAGNQLLFALLENEIKGR